MLTGQEQRRRDDQAFRALTDGPVLRTWRGCMERVKRLSLGERWLLCRFLGCDIDRLDRALYRYVKQRHKRGAGDLTCE